MKDCLYFTLAKTWSFGFCFEADFFSTCCFFCSTACCSAIASNLFAFSMSPFESGFPLLLSSVKSLYKLSISLYNLPLVIFFFISSKRIPLSLCLNTSSSLPFEEDSYFSFSSLAALLASLSFCSTSLIKVKVVAPKISSVSPAVNVFIDSAMIPLPSRRP